MNNEFHQYTREMFRRRKFGTRTVPFAEWQRTMVERMQMVADVEAQLQDFKTRQHS